MATQQKRTQRSTKKNDVPALGVSRRLQYFFLLAAGLLAASSLVSALRTLSSPAIDTAGQSFTGYLIVSTLTPLVLFALAYLIVGKKLVSDILGQLFTALLAASAAYGVSLLILTALEALLPQTISADTLLLDWALSTLLMVVFLISTLFFTDKTRLLRPLKLIFALAAVGAITSIAVSVTSGMIQQIPTNPNLGSFVGSLVFPLSLIGFIVALLLNSHIKSLLDRLFDAALIASVLFCVLSVIQLIFYEYVSLLWFSAINASTTTGESFMVLQTCLVIAYAIVIGAAIFWITRRRLGTQSPGSTRRNKRKN